MRVTIIILYALCFLGSGIAEAQDANSYYTRGEALYKQQQYDQAIDNLGKAITLNPNYSYSYLYRGLCYYAKQQYDLAIQDYNKVLAQTPADTYTYNARGNAYYAKQQYDLAIQDYNKAVSLNPNDPYTYTVRGLAYYGKQAYEPAIQDYTKAISMNANDYYSYTMRGLVYFATKDYALSLQDYNKALSVNPNNADAVYYRGNVYFIQTFYDLAIQDFSKAISLNNNYWSVYNARGTAYYYKAQYDLAIQDYTKAIQLAPNDTYAYYYRGFTNYVKKEYDQALQDLNKVIDLNPKYTDAFNMRGLTYKSKGDYGNAVNDFVKTISLDANYTKAYINIIEPLARMYRFADVSRYYATFRSKNTIEYIDDESYNFYKKYVEAITQNLTNNNYAGALLSLKEAEELYKNKKQNKDDYQKNSFATILALKGYVLEQLNKTEEAKQAYEQALVMNTLQPEINAALQRLAQKQQIFIKNDDTPPVITILEPAAKRSFTIEDDKPGATQRIRGKAFDASGIKKLTINNLPLKIEEAGYFETTVSIKEGTNVFTVVALDNNSNSTSENVVIEGGKINEKPQPAPAVAKAIDIPALANTSAYHALLIAESDYTDNGIKNLAGTRTDMRKMYKLLVNNYNFSNSNTDTLVNATKVNILESLIQKANAMKENDNLFIFYAGHGQMIKHEDGSEEGFLVPVDAGKNKTSSYISSDDLVRTIKYSKAKHILFVADACFAGGLFRDIAADAPEPVAEAYKDKSRKLLASGNRQAVPDESEFIEYLRLALQENKQKYITAEQLIDSFKNQYKTTTHLQLQYYPIKNVDDLGGQFVFTRK